MPNRYAKNVKKAFCGTVICRLLRPRKIQVYCTGTAKSGTNSIAALLGNQLRACHEPESEKLIDKIFDIAAGGVEKRQLQRFLVRRDRRLWLEVDSSQLNVFFINELVTLFPDAKFILTIRNPYSWLDSFINHQLSREASHNWIKLRNFRFRPDVHSHAKEESILKDRGLYALDGYLSYWEYHNRTVLDAVPIGRLLVVRTDEITRNAENIGRFVGGSSSNLDVEKSHSFKAKRKFGVVDQIDQMYLDEKIMEHCGDLMKKFFPEIQSRGDAFV